MPDILPNAPHAIRCLCDECLEHNHSYHDELILGCHICYPPEWRRSEEPIIDTEPCYTCLPQVGVERRLTGRTRTINPADPTTSYEMECGHWGI